MITQPFAWQLVRRFGTPLYVMDEEALRRRIREYQDALSRHYPGRFSVTYAGKAFLCKAMCRLVDQEGAGLDVASAGELATALKAGFPPQRIHLHGNCKTSQELEMALKARIHRIVIDNEDEMERIQALARRRGTVAAVLLRLAPAVDVATHHFIKTGHADTKFGIPIEKGRALAAAQRALRLKNLRLMGFHAHLGSQIFDLRPLGLLIETLFDFLKTLQRRTGYVIEELNIGGGLAVQYASRQIPPTPADLARIAGRAVLKQCLGQIYPLPKLMIEPGRSIAAPAGITLYQICYVKKLPSGKTFAIVDGGLSDNPRPALYGAKYRVTLIPAGKPGPQSLVTISGKHCETDTLFENIRIPYPKPGDLLMVHDTGAYNYSMASNYNRYPRPSVVFVNGFQARLVVRRETIPDVFRCDL